MGSEAKSTLTFDIVTPNRNGERFLMQTIESVARQQGPFSINHFIVDGASSDSSVALVKEYQQRLENIQAVGNSAHENLRYKLNLLSERDTGQVQAINKGIQQGHSEIVAYINSDDVYVDGAFAEVAGVFLRNPTVSWIYGFCSNIDEQGKQTKAYAAKYRDMLGSSFHYGKLLITNYIRQPTVFLRRTIIERFGLFDESCRFCMDYEYWCRIGRECRPLSVRRALASFRFHPRSITSQALVAMRRESQAISQKYGGGTLYPYLHRMHDFVFNRER